MASPPEYVILGNGRWAGVMHKILAEQSRVTVVEQTRRREQESDQGYQARIQSSMAGMGGAKVAWICVPPSPNTPLMAAAALESGMHVIAEKPWVWKQQAGRALAAQAHANGLLIGVHYEYCLLDAVQSWRSQLQGGAGCEFSGRFATSRSNPVNIPAMENLGSHLFAIRAYAVPEAKVSAIYCGYGQADERSMSLVHKDGSIDTVDFLANREPIIQRFIAQFESAMDGGGFPFSLDFAIQVFESLDAFRTNPEPNTQRKK